MIFAAAPAGTGTLVRVKVVPGASRSRIVGVHGDALKLQVSAPPERGRANEAVCELLAERLGIPGRDVTVVRGAADPRKTVHVRGISAEAAERALTS